MWLWSRSSSCRGIRSWRGLSRWTKTNENEWQRQRPKKTNGSSEDKRKQMVAATTNENKPMAGVAVELDPLPL